ncbi:MAG: ABC transporter ATP-binding protein [Thermodesulfobacteriota bacterium]
MSLLTLDNLCSGYQKLEVLHNIDLFVDKGEVVNVIGANGAGKSTLMHTICGVLPVQKGEITYKDTRIDSLPTYLRVEMGMGYVPQDANIFPDLTVQENLEMGGFTISNLSQKIEEVFDYFPKLKERNTQYASTLSGGERQMLAVGSALLTSPDLLILDEPISGLSPQASQSLIESITNINKGGCSLLWVVEENPRESLSHADRVYLLSNGKVVKEGSSDDFLADENFEKLFLGHDVDAASE